MITSTRKIVFAAVTAAAYAALTMLLAPISYGAIQFRVSEVLCILPYFAPCSAWGLFIGCAIANIISIAGPLDIVFGSLATLLSSLCVAAIGKAARRGGGEGELWQTPAAGEKLWRQALACAMPVIFNGPVVGAVIAYTATPDAFWQGFFLFGAQVAAGEAVVMFVLGLPLMRYLPRLKIFSARTQNIS